MELLEKDIDFKISAVRKRDSMLKETNIILNIEIRILTLIDSE